MEVQGDLDDDPFDMDAVGLALAFVGGLRNELDESKGERARRLGPVVRG
jgi:hypothetical protein